MYYGFAYHTELIKQNMPSGRAKIALEIGVGAGHCVIELSRNFEKIYGFDISEMAITLLKKRVRIDNLYLDVVDACSPLDESYYNKFDFVFSIDTLEHVRQPDKFFDNIKLLLKDEATALVLFPNEAKENHHGINWYDTKKDLLRIIPHGLKITKILEVKYTKYFDFIRNYLWLKPRSLVKLKDAGMHTFETTSAYSLNMWHPMLANLLAIYPYLLLQISKLGKMFIYKELESELESQNINNKYLLIKLKKPK